MNASPRDPTFDNFVKAWDALTDEQRERFGKEYASLLFDLIGDYPCGSESEPLPFAPLARRRAQ